MTAGREWKLCWWWLPGEAAEVLSVSLPRALPAQSTPYQSKEPSHTCQGPMTPQTVSIITLVAFLFFAGMVVQHLTAGDKSVFVRGGKSHFLIILVSAVSEIWRLCMIGRLS